MDSVSMFSQKQHFFLRWRVGKFARSEYKSVNTENTIIDLLKNEESVRVLSVDDTDQEV